MSLKKRKSVMLIMLSLILSASGCKQDDSYKKESHATVEEMMDDYPFYQKEESIKATNKEEFSPFYYNYLDKFINYMDKEQYNTFLNIVSSMDESEKEGFEKTLHYLDEIMGSEKDKYGRGIYRAFNNRLVYESFFSARDLYIETYKEINTLRSIVNNDEAFFSSLFSKNIDKFIDCIQDNTNFTNKDLIQELILNIDLYCDIASKKEHTVAEEELQKTYNNRIKDIMGMLIQSKLTTDQEFANTFYGNILKNSQYMKNHTSDVTQELLGDQVEFSILSEKYQEFYSFYLSTNHLSLNMTISEIKASKINEIISDAYKEIQYSNAMNLMIHLVDPDNFNQTSNDDPDTIRLTMYEDLKKYFKDIEEFNDFFLLADCYREDVIEDDYFAIINNRIKENGITIDDFTRYTSLVNLINDNNYAHYEWDIDVDHPPIKEIENLPKEEAEKIVKVSGINDLFSYGNYKTHLEKIANTLKENNLGYEMIYNPECKYEYGYGRITVQDDSNSVISHLVESKEGIYSGINIVYYEIPEHFEDGKAISVFTNIKDELTIKELEGFKVNFFDEISGRQVNGFIVGIGNQQNKTEDNEPIRFMEYYKNYEEKKNTRNKQLILGVNQ